MQKETGLSVSIERLLCVVERKQSSEYFFLVSSEDGDLRIGGPEDERQSASNQYSLEWVPTQNLESITLLPEEAKEQLVSFFRNAE